ncbi:fumarylacetoacetate hydrolase family protein [Aquabacterium sp. OR-4]|uniref:fumarylacetoacetate hydrolase family protein n=1 Tax=Aquabacterium sp. OR-4 TaxID=2978127 RepID=UPI0028CB0351|nr:fumarylacetoacetate hydrolase family protein [Aquabacterium sp. OR-4]MDT7839040.1 fumarylacetoacetate hydrolase family protein [Aquabacterium sp. OR-4]
MPLSPEATALCAALLDARRSGRPLPPDAAALAAVPDDETACALQQAQGVALGAWAAEALPRFWKSGGPRRDGPLAHAPLLPAGVQPVADGDCADLRAQPFLQPMVEAEVALRLGREVSPALAATLGVAEAESLIDALAVAVEVVDTRWASLADAPPRLKLADFQVHGALVLGPWQAWDGWRGHDWAAQRGQLRLGDAAPINFQGTHTLGTPGWLLPIWLRHLTRHGHSVPAGTVVTTGSWSGCRPVARGSRVAVQFQGLGGFTLQV